MNGNEIHQLTALKVEPLEAGTYKYYLNGMAKATYDPPDGQIIRRHLLVTYYPTTYGTVSSIANSTGNDSILKGEQ